MRAVYTRLTTLAAGFLTLLFLQAPSVLAEPRLWGTDGAEVRAGRYVRWGRDMPQDAQGNTLLVWSDARAASMDVYAQLLDNAGVEQWAPEGILLSSAPRSQTAPSACAVTGGWIVAWVDFRSDSLGDIYAQKIDGAGNRLWNANAFSGVPVQEGESWVIDGHLQLVHDGQGGAIIAWTDYRLDNGDVRAQRVDAAGTVAWSQYVAVAEVPGGQYWFATAGDGNGNMLLAWMDERDPSNRDIYAAKVTTGGQTPWGLNGLLVCGDASHQRYPSLCPDGIGGCFVAWEDYRQSQEPDLYMQRVDGTGQMLWTPNGVPLCGISGWQGAVQLALSRNGDVLDGLLAVWIDRRAVPTGDAVYAQKVSPQGAALWLSGGILICQGQSSGSTTRTRLVSDGAGGLVVTWSEWPETQDQTNVLAARILADGNPAWNHPCGVNVTGSPGFEDLPGIALGLDRVIICYKEHGTTSGSLFRQMVNLATGALELEFPAGEVVHGLTGDTQEAQAIAMSGGRAGVVWRDSRAGYAGPGLYYQIFSPDGEIERTADGDALVPGAEGYSYRSQEKVRLCPDGAGGFFAAFEDLRTGLKRIRLTRVNSAGELACDEAARVVWEATGITDQGPCFVAPDGTGGCYVAWSGFDAEFYMDVFVMRLGADCQRLWTQPLRLTDTDDDDLLYGVVPSADGCIVAWRSGFYQSLDVMAAAAAPDGTLRWSGAVCNAVHDQDQIRVLADGLGGAFLAWEDDRQPNRRSDIYAQHLNAAGQALWPPNGALVISDTLYQRQPALALDPAGNLLVAWHDFRSGLDLDIYAQKLSPAGAPLWDVAGLPVAVQPHDQHDVVALSDGNDGIFLAWTDQRPGTRLYAVYGTHLDANGAPEGDTHWLPQGGPLGDAGKTQYEPVIAASLPGTAVVVWTQDNVSDWEEPYRDLQAQRIFMAAVPAAEEPSVLPARFALHECYPNPFNPGTTIAFDLPRAARVKLVVYDLLGREVAVLHDAPLEAGRHEARFNAAELASGLYFYRLEAGSFSQTRKMMLIK